MVARRIRQLPYISGYQRWNVCWAFLASHSCTFCSLIAYLASLMKKMLTGFLVALLFLAACQNAASPENDHTVPGAAQKSPAGKSSGSEGNEVRPGDDVIDRHPSHLIYTKHARCRMKCRFIDESEVQEILEKGRINYRKSEPAGRPDPKYALEGTTHDAQHVRIVFAPSQRGMVVITVIDLDTDWDCNCK